MTGFYGQDYPDVEVPPPWEDTPPAEAAAELGASWRPVDLAETVNGLLSGTLQRLQPTVGDRGDGRCLFYRGKVNGVAGASGSGKSWTALVAAAQRMQAGEHVVYVDLEDDAAGVVARLLDLGVAPELLHGPGARFHYLSPNEAYSTFAAAHVEALVVSLPATLVVIDSTGESMALDGAKPNDDDDVARWFRRLPTRLARLGPAVVVLDHVVKAEDGGLWPIGSQRKRAAVSGAQYMQSLVKPFDQDTEGWSKLVCAKDRHGNYRQGAKVAELHVTPGAPVLAALRAPAEAAQGQASGEFRPTALMERVSRYLEGRDEPVSFRGIDKAVEGKQEYIAQALDALVAEGYVTRKPGPRSANLHTSARPYRQADDPRSDAYEPGETVGPESVSPGTVTVSPSKDGTGETDTQPSPGDSRETVGDGQTLTRATPLATPSKPVQALSGTDPEPRPKPSCALCSSPNVPPGRGICDDCDQRTRRTA